MAGAVAPGRGEDSPRGLGKHDPERVGEVAGTGVDLISVGALTHSVTAADISLNVTQVEVHAPHEGP